MKTIISFLSIFIIASSFPVSANELYIFPELYEHSQTKECVYNQQAATDLIEKGIVEYCSEGKDKPKVEKILDLNNDGKCEIFVYPPRCFVGSGGGWYDIFELKEGGYEKIGSMSSSDNFLLGKSRNGYARIIVPSYRGHKTNPILTTSVLFFDGKEYMCEHRGKYTRGYYMDKGKDAYKKGNYDEADIYYLNAYRMNLGNEKPFYTYAGANSRLLDANNLAITWIKLNMLNEAEKIIKKHIRMDEKPVYLAAAYFNLGKISEIKKKYDLAIQFYTQSDALIPSVAKKSKIDELKASVHAAKVAAANERVKFFRKAWIREYSVFSKGIQDIEIKGKIKLDTQISLTTGMLNAEWQDTIPISFPILNIQHPEHIQDVELIFALTQYEKRTRNVTGYCFVAYISTWSRTVPSGRGHCGAGTENELVFFYVNERGELESEDRYLVLSCVHNVGKLFIRSSMAENEMHVTYITENDIMNFIHFDYLYPEKGVFYHQMPIVFNKGGQEK